MKVFVAGVNGQVGRGLATRAQEQGFEVVGGSAHRERVGQRPYEVLPVDLARPDTLRSALHGVAAAFLYPSAAAIEDVVAVLSAADLQHLVVMTSSAAVLPGAERLGQAFRVVEDAIQESDLPWTILRPDAFASNSAAWAGQVRARSEVALPYPDAQVTPVHEDDVVDAALAALSEDRHRNRAYMLTGPESMTQRQQVQVIGEALGRELGVLELTPDQWRAAVRDAMPGFVADALLDVWAATVHTPQRTDQTVQQLTGQRPRTYAEWVAGHADLFS